MKRKTILLMTTLVYIIASVLYPSNALAYTSVECCFHTHYWFGSGDSRFFYSGPIIERGEETVRIRVDSICRQYKETGSDKWEDRPCSKCMPYTDEHHLEFESKYGSFCISDTIWVDK